MTPRRPPLVRWSGASGSPPRRSRLPASNLGAVFFERTFKEGFHALLDFLASFENGLFEMPESPIVCPISSTQRVDNLPIQASWMTATNTFFVVLRASRNGRK